MLEMLQYLREHSRSERLLAAVEALAESLTTEIAARAAWRAYAVGQLIAWDRAHGMKQWHAGTKAIEGGIKGQFRRASERKAPIERARTRYAFYAAKFPEVTRAKLCEMVGNELKVAATTVATWVPNPKPTRRGRPKKK